MHVEPNLRPKPIKSRLAHSWWLYVWSLLWELTSTLVLGLISLVAHRVRPAWAKQLLLRRLKPEGLRSLAKLRDEHPKGLLFFCSSAGEYEQALPLLQKLEDESGAFSLLVFFSYSGFSYAAARNERRPYLLAPGDSVWQWQKLFQAVRPSACFVVRHELWPGFLSCASLASKLYLINASSTRAAYKKLQSWRHTLKGKLLRNFFARIYVVSLADKKDFLSAYGLAEARLRVSGDTKYDRVFQRAALNRPSCQQFRTLFSAHSPQASRLMVGSAWPADVAVALEALSLLSRDAASFLPNVAPSERTFLQVVIALHVPSEVNLEAVIGQCEALQLSYRRLSQLSQPGPAVQVLLVDRMGILAELYGSSHLALVGGALHYQVHNVLEPACYALPLAFGPLYKNSAEACLLVQAGAAKVLQLGHELGKELGKEQARELGRELATWWGGQLANKYQDGKKVLAAAQSYVGASDAIASDLLKAEQQDLWQ